MQTLTATHGCDLCTEPNRQGYLILGPCPSVPISMPEPCPTPPAEPDFGILRCKCLKSRFKLMRVTSGTTPLRPHDRVRLTVKAVLICDL